MRGLLSSVAVAVSLLAPLASAKDKTPVLPVYLLHARTVAVLVDPSAGGSAADPEANRTAQKDVETALINWGRFEPILTQSQADLIIVVRKGNGRIVNGTVRDPRQNNRPVMVDPTDTGVTVGAQRGHQPGISANPADAPDGPPRPHIEAGQADDSFSVYEGNKDDPLDDTPGWRYVAKDGLRSHDVPAVDAFRKALAEAEKAAAKKP